MRNRSGNGDRGRGAQVSSTPSPDDALISCAQARELLPVRDLSDARTVALEAHVDECPDCSAEAEFLVWMRGLRPEPPAKILSGVLERAGAEVGPARREPARDRWGLLPWGLSAAALAVLSVGLGILWDRPTESLWTLALEPEPSVWYGDDWLVAGGPVPEALSDELLTAILEEMDP